MALHPAIDSQQLRTLIRNAQKEQAADKPPKSSREIFRLLREITTPDNQEESAEDSETADTDE
jgi:ribosome-associated protein